MKTFLLLSFALALSAATIKGAEAGAAPATLTKEGDLTMLVLKPEAEARLRLKIVPLERRKVPATRLFAGEVVMPLAAAGGVAPVLGGTLDEVLRLADLQATAEGRVLQADVQVEAAKTALERATKLQQVEAGSVRTVDEAKTALAMAEAAATTAKAQREILGGRLGQADGARRYWVRAAVYSGESGLLDAQGTATVRPLTVASGGVSAKPVAGPPTANALTSTVDWYFELPAEGAWRAGEKVAVEIPRKEGKDYVLTVPFTAVLHDINGGQWVYQQTVAHTYVRRRIQVVRVAGNDAVITTGLVVGSQVVTDGAAELFGTEFLTGK